MEGLEGNRTEASKSRHVLKNRLHPGSDGVLRRVLGRLWQAYATRPFLAATGNVDSGELVSRGVVRFTPVP